MGKQEVKAFLQIFYRRLTRSWLGLILTGALVLGIAILLEIISFNHNVRFDLTPTQSYSLSEQTIDLLKRIDKDIKFTVFYRQGERIRYDELFRQLSLYTSHIKYTLIDLDRNPGQAKLQGISAYEQTLVEWEGKKELLSGPTEDKILRLIIKYIRPGKRGIYFTTGHGENSPQEKYRLLSDVLEAEGWQVGVLNLSEAAIPAGDSVLVIGGSQRDFSDEELRKLTQYLDGGGKMMLLIEPFVRLPNINSFLEKYRIGLGDGIIVDTENKLLGSDYLAPLISNFAHSPITNSFKSPAIFFTARPLLIKAGGSRTDLISFLASSSPASWVRRGEEKSERIDFKEGVDLKGPVPVAIIANVPSGGNSRLGKFGAVACFGDADFVSNEYIEMLANKNLFVNTVSWLGMERELVSNRPQKYEFPFHFLTKKQGLWIFWVLVVFLPALPLTIGLCIFIYRRWRG